MEEEEVREKESLRKWLEVNLAALNLIIPR